MEKISQEHREALRAAFGARDHFRDSKKSLAVLVDMDATAAQAEQLETDLIKALANHPSVIQGFALAQVLSLWVSGHRASAPLATRSYQQIVMHDTISAAVSGLSENMSILDEIGQDLSPTPGAPSV